jgi:hypothetical protein
MKQTAVEWLAEQLPIYGYNVVTVFPELIEQAKEIEKKQQSYSEEDLDMLRKFMIQEQNFSKSCLDVFIEQFKKK